MRLAPHICFVFLDGVGLAPPGIHNPLSQADMPCLRKLLGRPLVTGPVVDRPGLLFRPLDARLGVDGLPQSATGQTALLTGVNAVAQVGRHLSAYPPPSLQEILASHSILKQVADAGLSATFANAYTSTYWQHVQERRLRHSVTTWANLAAKLPFRDLGDLARGEAVYWDITHRFMREHLGLKQLPLIEPQEAGRRLAILTTYYHFVLFESFLPDLLGHRRLDKSPETILRILDGFFWGLLTYLPENATVVISSDHGNVEDDSVRTHTANPVPLIVVGPGSQAFRKATAITDVTPAILDWLTNNSSRNGWRR